MSLTLLSLQTRAKAKAKLAKVVSHQVQMQLQKDFTDAWDETQRIAPFVLTTTFQVAARHLQVEAAQRADTCVSVEDVSKPMLSVRRIAMTCQKLRSDYKAPRPMCRRTLMPWY